MDGHSQATWEQQRCWHHRRAKFAEGAFLGVYQKLYDAPDPAPTLTSALVSASSAQSQRAQRGRGCGRDGGGDAGGGRAAQRRAASCVRMQARLVGGTMKWRASRPLRPAERWWLAHPLPPCSRCRSWGLGRQSWRRRRPSWRGSWLSTRCGRLCVWGGGVKGELTAFVNTANLALLGLAPVAPG